LTDEYPSATYNFHAQRFQPVPSSGSDSKVV